MSAADAAAKKAEQERRNALRSCVLTGQRLQNIGIALKRVQIPVDDLCRALITCDGTILPIERRETLMLALPTPEDVAALGIEKKAGRVVWSEVETYLYTLATRVKDVRERMQLWTAAEQLEETVQSTAALLKSVEMALEAVTAKNGRFARMMQAILILGNFLNRGTVYGNAEGFRLENLGQLNFIKSVDGKTTLLTTLLVLLLNSTSSDVSNGGGDADVASILDFTADVNCIRAISSSPLQDIGQEVSQLNFTLQRMRRVVEDANSTDWYEKRLPGTNPLEMKDALPVLLSRSVEQHLTTVGQLTMRFQELRDDASAMMATYGEDPNGDETILWAYVQQFAKDVTACLSQIETKHLTRDALMGSIAKQGETTAGGGQSRGEGLSTANETKAGTVSPAAPLLPRKMPKMVDDEDED